MERPETGKSYFYIFNFLPYRHEFSNWTVTGVDAQYEPCLLYASSSMETALMPTASLVRIPALTTASKGGALQCGPPVPRQWKLSLIHI